MKTRKKEIKENIDIKINNKAIPFSYFYKFKEKGRYIIQYKFKNKLFNINYMFYGINLSKFYTQNVT